MKLFSKKPSKYEILTNELISLKKSTDAAISSYIDSIDSKLNTVSNQISALSKKIPHQDRLETPLLSPTANTKKRILVAGFFGAFNLGDELMLETALTALDDTEYDITIMLADNHRCDVTRYGNYDFVFYPNSAIEMDNLARHFDAVLFPGGALIDDDGYGLNEDRITLGTILTNMSLRFIDRRKKCLLYGLSANSSLDNPEFISKLQKVIDKADHFSLRDSNSLKALESAGIDTADIKIVDDIAFANRLLADGAKAKNKLKRDNVTSIGLIFVYSEADYQKTVDTVRNILDQTSNSTPLELILFYDYCDNDYRFASNLINDIGSDRLSIASRSLGDYRQTVDLINNYSHIVSVRYHGALLSNSLGIPTLCINYDTHRHYDNKISYLYSHYGFARFMLDSSSLPALDKDVFKAFLEGDVNEIDIAAIHNRSVKDVRELLKLL